MTERNKLMADLGSPYSRVIEAGSFRIICNFEDCDLSSDDEDHYARLFAAAPELLDALEMVRDADNDCEKDGLKRIPYHARMKIDKAIAKAKGETP